MCLFLEPLIFGEAKSTDSRAMGFLTDGRTDGRTHGHNFEKRIFEIAFVRPSVQEPIALESVDFASPKMGGSQKKDIPLLWLFLTSNQSILCRKKGLRQKNRYLLSKQLFFL